MVQETMSIKSNRTYVTASEAIGTPVQIEPVTVVLQQIDTKPILIDATYELVKDFGFNALRDSLKDGSFYKNSALIILARKRFKRLSPLNPDISLMVDPEAIFSDRKNSIFLNILVLQHPEVYLRSLQGAISNGFNRETFLEGLTQDDIVIILNQVDETVFKGKETILFQYPKEFFENPINERRFVPRFDGCSIPSILQYFCSE
ncbi:hypothetical protein BC833DRAFT_654235 [Globomyces pollinis-pini]|nr:hypothetical protein BC833DRAFT_654235 [Globomyces pollinis-pini]